MKKLMAGLAALAVLGFFTGCDNMGGISEPETSGGSKTEQTATVPLTIRPKLLTYLQ